MIDLFKQRKKKQSTELNKFELSLIKKDLNLNITDEKINQTME
jgi:hypothetical protein